MLPPDSHKRIRSVRIHHNSYIGGFKFFDKEGALLWEIGKIDTGMKVKTVLLAENEVIVGVVAKLLKGWQSLYSHF